MASPTERAAADAVVRAGIIAALRACRLFAGLPPELVEAVAELCSLTRLPAGATVFRIGDRSRTVYVVERGRIVARVRSSEGHALDVGVATTGECFGYFELFDGRPRDSDAVALEPSTVVGIPHPAALRLISSSPETLLGVIADLLRIVRLQNQAAIEKHSQTVSVRVATLLLQLADGRGRVLLDDSQTLVAQRLGTTRQTVSKTLHGFAAEGLVIVHPGGRRITLLDRDRLLTRSGAVSLLSPQTSTASERAAAEVVERRA